MRPRPAEPRRARTRGVARDPRLVDRNETIKRVTTRTTRRADGLSAAYVMSCGGGGSEIAVGISHVNPFGVRGSDCGNY